MTFNELKIRLKRPYVRFTYFLARRKRIRETDLRMREPKEVLNKRDELYKRYLEADKVDNRVTETKELRAQIKSIDWVVGKIGTLCLLFCILCGMTLAEPGHTPYSGQVTTNAGTAVQLSSTSTSISSVSVKALSTNTGLVYVGGSSVDSTNGRELEAGEGLDWDISNLNKLYFDVSVNGEGVSYGAIK